MDLANWALRTSPKFTTGVKYQFHQGFLTRSEIRKSQSPFAPYLCISINNVQSHLYIRRGNRGLSLAALPGLPAASRGVKLPLLANTRSVF